MPRPHTIPYDLKLALEATQTPEAWQHAFHAWAKRHRLRLKLQWMRSLTLELSELDRRRTPPTDQDRWGVILDWLEQHRVEAPVRLPVTPESPGGKFV